MTTHWINPFWIGCIATLAHPLAYAIEEDPFALDLDDIASLDVEVTSVSKKAQKLSDSAAAIFVISNEDIRRSGATSIPEALRMAPGVNVARINANQWAITTRGLNGRFANKLLVLLDGRSVYIPSFSGVYWEQLDTLMADIERIEVIRGPGATLWGSNAVNGIINIITKHGADISGPKKTAAKNGLFSFGGGNQEQDFANLRYAKSFGDATYGRVYLKTHQHDNFEKVGGGSANDDWDFIQSGFRFDSQLDELNIVQIQGDIYKANFKQQHRLPSLTPPQFDDIVNDNTNAWGGNLLGKWQHANFSLQVSYDTFSRDEATLREMRDTFNIDAEYRFRLGHSHEVISGVGYRYSRDAFSNSFHIAFDPDERSDSLYSAFIQDEISLIDNALWLTLGTKLEHNAFTGFEYQPSARILWAFSDKQRVWGAVSRALRTPSRADQNSTLRTRVFPPFFLTTFGDPDYDAEILIAWELGYRFAPSKTLSFDLTSFYHEYDEVRGLTQGAPSIIDGLPTIPLTFNNELGGRPYGWELSTVWQVYDAWRLDLTYSYLEVNIETTNLFEDTIVSLGPRNQASLRSQFDLSPTLELDFWFRYVDEVQAISNIIDDYFTMDIHLAWRPTKTVELSLVGQNLLDSRQQEFEQELFIDPVEIERGVYAKVAVQF